jgi:hypothetical protein
MKFWRIHNGKCLAVALHVLLHLLGYDAYDLQYVIKEVDKATISRGVDPENKWAVIGDVDKFLSDKLGAKLVRAGQGGARTNLSDCKDKELANLCDKVQRAKFLRFECQFKGGATTTHIVVLHDGFLYNGPPSYRVAVTEADKKTKNAARSFFDKYVAAAATKCILRDAYILEKA